MVVGGAARAARAARAVRWILLGLTLAVLIRTAWMCDDAYITLRTIDNLVHGYGLRWNVAERVQSFTHPLWFMVMCLPYLVTRESFYTVVALSIGVSLAAVGLLVFRSRATSGAVIVAVPTLLCSLAFTEYSTSGLENPLTHLLLIVFLLSLDADRLDFRRLLRLSLITGLATLNRMDTLLLFTPGLVLSLIRFGRPKGLAALAVGFAPFLMWEVFATFYYGLPVPNTALAKLHTGIDSWTLMRHGLYYLLNSLGQDPVTLVIIVVAMAAAVARSNARLLSIALGIALYVLYVIRIGGDFMSGRYLSAPFFAAVVLLVQARFFAIRRSAAYVLALVALLAAVTPYPPFLTGRDFGAAALPMVDRHGIADERRFYFRESGMLSDMPGTTRPTFEARRVGEIARRTGAPILVEGAIGFTGYFAGPGVHIVDYHGLADPLLARLPMVDFDPRYRSFMRGSAEGVDREGWRIGHFLRPVPRGYLETLLSGSNRIEDPALARLYDEIALVARGPLWSGRRIAAIVRLNLGRDDPGFEARRRPAYTPPDWDEVIRARPDAAEGYFQRAQASYRGGQLDRAREDLDRALRIAPGHPEALALLADAYEVKGDLPLATATWRRAAEAEPREITPYLRLADLSTHAGDDEQAIGFLRRALDLDPRLAPACIDLARAYEREGHPEAAVVWLQRAKRLQPRSAEPRAMLGRIYMGLGDTRHGLQALEEALAIEPCMEPALIDAATAYAKGGDQKRARELLDRALAANPNDPPALYGLGLLSEFGGRVEEALEYWRRSARLGYDPALKALAARTPSR